MIFLISILFFLFSENLAAIFISDRESIEYGSLFIKRAAPFYILCVICMLYSQILRGLGNSLIPTIITFAGFVLLRQTILFVGTKLSSSFWIVSLAYPVVWIFTSAVMLLYFRFYMKKTKFL